MDGNHKQMKSALCCNICVGVHMENGRSSLAHVSTCVQDNWFMVTAVLKEQYGITMEEDLSARPSCLACRRHNITLHLQKIY